MKTLTMKQKIAASIVAAMLLIYGIQDTNYVQAQDNAPELTPVADRTQQVQDTIVALVPGVDSANDVTAAHLTLITNLNLSDQSITALKTGDFDGLSTLRSLSLAKNTLSSLPTDIFAGLSSLNSLDLGSNQLSSLPDGVFSELSSMSRLNLAYNSLAGLSADTFSGMSSLTGLDLGSNQLSDLPAGIFSGLSVLNWLSLSSNQLSDLPAGIFSGLSSLNSLYLGDNTVDLFITVSLEKIEGNQFKATAPTGAPFNIVLPITVTNGSIDGGATTITIPAGSVESGLLTVIPTPGTSDAAIVDIGTLPELPTSHFGYSLSKPSSADNTLSFALGIPRPTGDPNVNHAPIFREGSRTTRSIQENTPAGRNIGSPVTATDADEDTLTYTLRGTDAASFGIVSTSGQLQTRASLDYEKKNTYAVTVIVSDGSATDTISVTIDVIDEEENNAPVFVEGTATERSIAENTPAGRNIGSPVTATDLDEEDILTYSLSGADAASFDIISTTGQLRTRAPLDYEKRNTYSVAVNVSDGNGGTDSIGVAINVTDVEENNDPVFVEGTATERSIAENTPAGRNIGSPVTATDEDEDILTYTLSGADAASFGIVSTTGQLRTRAPLDYEKKNTYSVAVLVSDGKGGTDTIGVAINVTDEEENNDPVFVEGSATERSIPENTPAGRNIGSPVTATDEDEDILTYTLSGADAASFGIVSTTGQLRTRAPLDYERRNTYSVAVLVSDGKGGTDTIGVGINVTDIDETPTAHAPEFIEGTATERSIPENTPAGRNIGAPVSATDEDEDVLTYTLSGVDAASFGIVSTTGQLRTLAPLDYEQKNVYSVAVIVSDGTLTDTIGVTINVTDVAENNAPVFASSSTTRTIAENTPAGRNIGNPITATDADGDTLTYTLGGTDVAAFSIVGTTGQLQTRAPLDYETKKAYAVTVTASDGKGGTDTIRVTINVTDLNEAPPTVDETPPVPPIPPPVVENPLTVDETSSPVDVSPQPTQGQSVVSISEIMYGSESRFTPPQWIEINNAGSKPIDMTGWKLIFQNVDRQDLIDGPLNGTIVFEDEFWGDAPRIWPNDFLLIVVDTDENSGGFMDDQIFSLTWRGGLDISFWDTFLSSNGFLIQLIDQDGNLVDEAGNYDGTTTLWDLPYNFNKGRTRAGNRTSLIRRYVDGLPLNGTQVGSWITAAEANLTKDQLTYYGDRDDISTPGIGIVINEISTQFVEYDVNQDGVVNVSDLVIVAGRIGQSGPNVADVNGDGVINVQDLILVAGAINEPQAAPALHPTSLEMFTAADIRGWLTQAQGLTLTDPKLQKGIRFLEQLLSVLVPKETELLPNYPNPFNPETWIPYRLAEDAFVTVTIYDQRGSVVRRLNVGHQTAAVYESRSKAIYWDGRNAVGDRVASGIYFYTLIAGDFSATRKMLILK